jgi:hypothetical protein
MKYDRVFTFGCSWTRYIWPSWADIIKYTDQAPTVYNWGKPGIGNVGIFYRMIECDLKNKFTENDLIIVQWSAWTREDRFSDQWETYGNVFNSPYYDKSFTKKYWSWNNDVIKNGSCIVAANRMFNIGYQFNMIPFLRNESGHVPDLGDLIKPWHDTYFDALPEIDTFPTHLNTQFNGNLNDGHPDIRMSVIFFNNYIKDRFGFTLNKNEPKLLKLYNTITNKVNPNMKYDDSQKIIIEEVQKFDPTWTFDKEGW